MVNRGVEPACVSPRQLTPQSMAEGYDRTCERAPMWLDELLCEYVDGTMDHVVCRAFEECLAMDHGLAAQVKRLRSTRSLLCRYRCKAPRDLRARVRRRLAEEMMLASGESETDSRGGWALALILLAGLFAGTTWFAERAALPVEETVRFPVTMTPLVPPPDVPSFVNASSLAALQPHSGSAFHSVDGGP